MAAEESRLSRVELVDEERVVDHGIARVVWFVRFNDDWRPVSEWPGARVERLQAPAGTVWASRIQFEAPAGTRLLRVEKRPMPPARRSALDYLKRGNPRLSNRTTRHYYHVGKTGGIERERSDSAPR